MKIISAYHMLLSSYTLLATTLRQRKHSLTEEKERKREILLLKRIRRLVNLYLKSLEQVQPNSMGYLVDSAQGLSPLTEVRHSRGLNLQELADRLSVSPSQLWRIENGQRRCSLNLLYRLAQELECQPADLLPRINKENAADFLD